MEKTTLIGIISGLLFIVISIMLDGSVGDFINLPSVFIVIGGVIAATVVSYPMKVLTSVVKVMGNAFKQHNVDLNGDVEMIIRIANIARREGILALENVVNDENDPFLRKGIMLIVDGTDPELVRGIMETDLSLVKERHSQGQSVLTSMSSYSPAFGMIGTLIGLINMLKSLDDPDALGPAMAVALITTLYGVILANLLFTPLAKKLKFQGDEECLRKELLLEGMLSIQDGENPRIIREKLNAFLSVSQIQAIEAQQQNQQQNPQDAPQD
ncbi:MAG: motility protein A [Clostridiales bacterium]|nr:motility protein A [Clostridiales bacterium]